MGRWTPLVAFGRVARPRGQVEDRPVGVTGIERLPKGKRLSLSAPTQSDSRITPSGTSVPVVNVRSQPERSIFQAYLQRKPDLQTGGVRIGVLYSGMCEMLES
jgi:hypothetical protein